MANRPTDVQATLNYTLPSHDGEPFWTLVLRPPPPEPWTNLIKDPRDIVIHDARGREEQFSLDHNGFQFLKYPSTVPDLFDERSIKKLYYPEIVQMLRELTGAERISIAGHMHRRSHPARQKTAEFTDITGPAYSVHGDRTMDAGRHLAEVGLGENQNGRYRIINVWRPVGNPAYDTPLAVLDYNTVDADRDLAPHVCKYGNQEIATLTAAYSERHMWYYLKEQTPDEVIIMKNYDSLTDGIARLAMHTAFDDPTCAPGALPRRSLEVRAYVYN